MKTIQIPEVKVEQVKLWAGRTLAGAAWLICLGLVGVSVAVAALGTLAWLVFGSEILLVAGLGGGLVIGLAGTWQVLRRLDRASAALVTVRTACEPTAEVA
jgi:hypothetical protein